MDYPDFGATKPDADLLVGAKGGNQGAFDQLFNRWFDKVWNISKSIVNDDDTATKLTQATFLSAWRQLHRLETPSTFGGRVLLTSRRKALDALENNDMTTKSRRISPGAQPVSGESEADKLVSDPTSRQNLLWAVAETLGDAESSLIDLRLRYGLSSAELAHELEISNKEVQQKIGEQTNQLIEAVRNFFLWNHGNPQCSKLGALIKGSETYTSSVVRTIKAHHISCGDCKTQRLRLQGPDKIFSSVPLSEPPTEAKTAVITKLAEDGLTVSSSLYESADESTENLPAIGLAPTLGSETPPAFSDPATDPTTGQRSETPDSLSDRFPSEVGSKITERFEPISVDDASGFAQDSPVRYSRRPPRVAPAPEPSRFTPSKAILVSAASFLFVVAVIAIIFTGRDPDAVSATAAPTTPSSSTTSTTAAALILPDASATDEVLAEVTTSAPTRRTTAAPTTTVPPTTTTTTSTTLAPTTTAAPVQVVVPQLANVPAALAIQTLTQLGLQPNIQEFETRNLNLVGRVRNTNPRAGSSVELGSNITVRVYVANN